MGRFSAYAGRLGIITALMVAMLTGCGEEKDIDYTIEGIEQEQPGSEGGNSELDRLREEEVWKEAWSEQNADGTTEIQINAPVTVPKTAKMAVVRVEEPEFDAEYKENLAKRLFESGEIYYADYSHMPKKDLEKLYAQLMEGGYIAYPELHRSIDALETEWQEMWEALDNMENAGDSYVPVEDYTGNQYIGLYEDRLYTLSFLDKDALNNPSDMRKIFWKVRDLEEVCPEKARDLEALVYYPWKRGNWVENQCRMSEEEAEKEARQFVDKLGLDYLVLSYTYPLGWGEEPDTSLFGVADSDKWLVDGYVFTFDLGMDDISFVSYGIETDYWSFIANSKPNKTDEETRYSINARLWVYVTDQGIIGMTAESPMEIVHVQEEVNLLPLDTVKGIIRNVLKEQWEVLRFNADAEEMSFDAMELIYFRVRDKENPGKYSYVPAWRLARVEKEETIGQISIRNPVLVNAIDGTLIDFFDET